MPKRSPEQDNLPNPTNTGIFGLTCSEEDAQFIIIPIPWDVTVSYRDGTSKGPEAVIKASPQLDLFNQPMIGTDINIVYSLPINPTWESENTRLRAISKRLITKMENGEVFTPQDNRDLDDVNAGCQKLHQEVEATAANYIAQGKIVGLLGGDHSTSLGNIQATAKHYPGMGLIQIDAHMDLRKCFERFPYSHASIIYNSVPNENIAKIVQVGIRDYCEFEYDQMAQSNGKVKTFFDLDIKERQFKGDTWHNICHSIIDTLPHHVYITFDIDGLTPAECPDTGTPVPGGFTFAEAAYLLQQIKKSGRKVVGFDLVEVAPSQNEINVINGARVLYELVKASLSPK